MPHDDQHNDVTPAHAKSEAEVEQENRESFRERWERASAVFRRVEKLGISDLELPKALGHTPSKRGDGSPKALYPYYSRFKSIATASEPDYTPARLKVLNEQLVTAIEGICNLLESARGPRIESSDQYVARTRSVINRLNPGSKHTLVCMQPPLESQHAVILRSVVEKAMKDVQFFYCIPSDGSISEGIMNFIKTDPGENASSTLRDRHIRFRRIFAWLHDIQFEYRKLMQSFLVCAARMDFVEGRRVDENDPNPSKDTYLYKVRNNIEFWPMKWIWVPFNEKLVWISKREQGKEDSQTIKKDIMILNYSEKDISSESLRHLDEAPSWQQVDYPMDHRTLRALIRVSRDKEKLPWPRVNTKDPESL